MNDNEMRILFAAFAMLKCPWDQESDEVNARKCFDIAEAMVKASKTPPEDEIGIVAIKKKRSTG